jgi:hypothetical protein
LKNAIKLSLDCWLAAADHPALRHLYYFYTQHACGTLSLKKRVPRRSILRHLRHPLAAPRFLWCGSWFYVWFHVTVDVLKVDDF